ncbi:MAG TPA: two-component regulator propeller domain-containing protein, partial [Bacteroidales bacterium]|nr:two-component regulator propeller domain-containing protein [Bacteroidales bacterium]
MSVNKRQIVTLLMIVLLGGNLLSQNFRFLNFGVEQGLCDNFIYNITQDPNGYLWLGTGEGICRYDGFTFSQEFPGDTLPQTPVTQSFRDSRGRLWFGFDDGQLAVLKGISFHTVNIPVENMGRINGICETSGSDIIIATQNKGIIRITPDNHIIILKDGLEGQLISSLCVTDDDGLLVGTFDGLFMYHFNNDLSGLELIGRFEDIPYTRVQTVKHDIGSANYWVGTEDQGLYLLQSPGKDIHSYTITKTAASFGLEYMNIQDIYEEKSGNLWLCTKGDGVYELQYSRAQKAFVRSLHFDQSSGLKANFLSSVFQDIEGNLWFGTTGEGLIVLKDQAFSFYNFEKDGFNDNILSLAQVDSLYWLGGENKIMITRPGSDRFSFLDTRNGLPDDRFTAIYPTEDEKVWIGTAHSGLYTISKKGGMASRVYLSRNSLENTINSITSSNDTIWVATNSGVKMFDTRSGQTYHYTTSEGLPHNKIRDIYVDDKDNVWIATRSNGLYNMTKREELAIDANAELEFIAITQDHNGDLWAGTNGDGIFRFAPDSLHYFSTEDGLRSNFCYSIATDANGNIWSGHRLGMSEINTESGNIRTFSVEEGISADCNYDAVITSSENELVFGTTRGLIIYDPVKDRADTIPPQLNITSLNISDKEYDFTKPVYLPYNAYKIRIDFIGINFKSPESVVYQYKLDGYDDWSEPTKIPSATYSRVEDGDYTFMLRACDENGICTETPLTLHIHIKIPIWKAWWFILLSIFAVISTVFIIIKLRERKQKQIQEYLQKALDERTREVMDQKEEIENKNRDITDSINYAQRIQASILPPIKRLHDTFAGSFVFYQPRDIVSGDFY